MTDAAAVAGAATTGAASAMASAVSGTASEGISKSDGCSSPRRLACGGMVTFLLRAPRPLDRSEGGDSPLNPPLEVGDLTGDLMGEGGDLMGDGVDLMGERGTLF